MNFNKHTKLEGQHVFLSASKYHWINYSEDKVIDSYLNALAAQKGTELHEFAATCIKLGQRLPKSKKTLNAYVNDAIGFRMSPEVVLYYSDNCFGTADSICFRDNFLRIHDYKSGVTPAHLEQLEIYAALFCLEYGYEPERIGMELRLYQSDEVIPHVPDPKDIRAIMKTIITFDKLIENIKEKE